MLKELPTAARLRASTLYNLPPEYGRTPDVTWSFFSALRAALPAHRLVASLRGHYGARVLGPEAVPGPERWRGDSTQIRARDRFRQRGPEVFFWLLCFWRPRVPRPENSTVTSKLMVFRPCRLRRQGQQTIHFLTNVWFFDLGTPGLQKTTSPKATSGPL